eukprot:3431045-Pleurochrysis_carterae.AAC.1
MTDTSSLPLHTIPPAAFTGSLGGESGSFLRFSKRQHFGSLIGLPALGSFDPKQGRRRQLGDFSGLSSSLHLCYRHSHSASSDFHVPSLPFADPVGLGPDPLHSFQLRPLFHSDSVRTPPQPSLRCACCCPSSRAAVRFRSHIG